MVFIWETDSGEMAAQYNHSVEVDGGSQMGSIALYIMTGPAV